MKFIRVLDTEVGPSVSFQFSWTQDQLTVFDRSAWRYYINNGRETLPRAGWHRMELFVDRPNGVIKTYFDGELHFSSTRVSSHDYMKGIQQRLFGWDQSVSFPSAYPEGTILIRDNIWIDDTAMRVEIADSPMWSTETTHEPQRAIEWTPTSITIEVNQDNLGSVAGSYLYVIGPDNEPMDLRGVRL